MVNPKIFLVRSTARPANDSAGYGWSPLNFVDVANISEFTESFAEKEVNHGGNQLAKFQSARFSMKLMQGLARNLPFYAVRFRPRAASRNPGSAD